MAGVFGYDGDEYVGGPNACTGRPMAPDELGVANRDLPCGASVLIHDPATGRSIVAKVVDRGPYGAKSGRHWVVKRKRSDPGVWRGCLDVSPAVARKLRFSGFGTLIFMAR